MRHRERLSTATVKAYAVTAATRLSSAPEIPTVDEAGLPGFRVSLWHGLWVPKGTPKDIIVKLNAAAVAALADPGLRRSRTGDFPARAADAGGAHRLTESRDRKMVADHQGGRHHGAMNNEVSLGQSIPQICWATTSASGQLRTIVGTCEQRKLVERLSG
jgi:Tripartite tricarboxylate transporter family receptor